MVANPTASSGPATSSTERVIAGFRAMAAGDPEHWIVVDASGDVDTVFARVRAAADQPVAR